MADGGEQQAYPEKLSAMVMKTGKHPGQLKDQFASPGGISISGIHELEKGAFRASMMNAIISATKRSHKLGQ
ncbi:Pyrroline-5-carboxylate reductase [Trema orientale]|uniref:Pyrroline-5-carboxylate reductase n=1 Tax=Trema orientale TaxID=63057 RepID=A0A2P5ECD3_TREOI|nr:Pyrroline-5-carboxylate reductase [Trema orientale]